MSTMASCASSDPSLTCRRLSNAGGFVDLFQWCQIRRMGLTKIQTLLPLFKINDLLMAFEFFQSLIAVELLRTLQHVDCIRAYIKGRDKELLTRRLSDCINAYLSTSNSAEVRNVDIPNGESFRHLRNRLRRELETLYDSQGDGSEADRMLQLDASVSSWSRPANRLRQLSSRLEHTAAKVLKGHDNIRRSLTLTEDPHFSLFSLLVQQHKGERDKFALRDSLCFSPDILGRSHLHLAVEMEDLDHLRWIHRHCWAEATKMIDIRDLFGLTPLMIAAYIGNVEVFKFLDTHGANSTALDPEGRSVLSLAAIAGHEDMVMYILSQHPSMLKDHFRTCSPLHDAAAAGHQKVVELLLKHKAEPRDLRDSYGFKKASEVAAKHNHTALEAYLLTVETRLEHEAMTSPADPVNQEIHERIHLLKEQIQYVMACSQSPESLPPQQQVMRTSSPRPSKRQRFESTVTQQNSPQSTFVAATPAPSMISPEAAILLPPQQIHLQHFSSFGVSPHDIIRSDVATDHGFSDFISYTEDPAAEWNPV